MVPYSTSELPKKPAFDMPVESRHTFDSILVLLRESDDVGSRNKDFLKTSFKSNFTIFHESTAKCVARVV